MWKTKEEMTEVELLRLRLGHYLTGKKKKKKTYYKVDYDEKRVE